MADTWWTEPAPKDDKRITLEGGDKVAKGQLGGRVWVKHTNTPDKCTRYWFKVNPGTNRQCDFKIGAHHLSNDDGEGDYNEKTWYIDDQWLISLRDGETIKECYVYEKDDYMKETKRISGVSTRGEDIVMLEIRGNSISLWIDNKNVARDFFVDKELNGPDVHVVVDFDKTDGDSIRYYGYDELPSNAPTYQPPTAAPQKGTPAKKPQPAPTSARR